MNKVITFLKKISLKQILAVFLAGFMVLTLAACGGAEVGDNSSEEGPVTTETTEQPAPDAAAAPADEETSASAEDSATSEEG